VSVDPSSRGWNEHKHRPGPVPLVDVNGVAQLSLWSSVGVPPASLGSNGDVCFRFDGAAGTTLYQKRSGAWVAVA
jgi:hypothetical protein